MNAIEVRNVSMQFKELKALNNVSVSFGENKIYGLLGRNGAGKSTLLNVITNRLFPTSGEVFVDGEKSLENDRALGKIFCMSEKNLYPDVSRVKQIFQWTKNFYPNFDLDYAKGLAEKFGLDIRKKFKELSTGYSSITKLILALASFAPYTLLDEPVLGLDANHRELFYREMLESYSETPRTIIISTHLIEEIADLIEQVIIIKNGGLLLDKPAEEVRQMGYSVSGRAEAVERYCEGKDVLSMDTLGGLKTACLMGRMEQLPEGLDASPLDMQKLFVRLTNE